MNAFIKKILYILLILSISVFIVNELVFQFYFSIHKRTKVDIYNNSSDVVFLGSSRCVNTIKPEVFTRETGLSSINVGWAASSLREVYSGVKIYLLRNKKPRYIFIQIDKTGWDTGISQLASQSLLKFFDRGIIDDYFTKELTEQLSIPFLANIFYRDFGWRELLKTLVRNNNTTWGNLGYAPVFGSEINTENKIEKFKFSASKYFSNKWLTAISNICKQNKIKLILFTAPYYNCYNGNDSTGVIKFNDFDYVNLSDLLVNPDLFKDPEHVNDLGADETTSRLGKLSTKIF